VSWLSDTVWTVIGIGLCFVVGALFGTRPAVTRRLPSHRNLLKGGVVTTIGGATALFFSLAAGTSGHAQDQDDALVFAVAGLLPVAVAAGLFVVWWQRAGEATRR
jgi:hypothetical protein